MKALLSDAIDDYLRWRKSQGIKPSTVRSQASVLRRFLAASGNIYTDKINELTITRYFEEAARTRQPQSLRNDHAALSVFFDWCRHTKRMSIDTDPLYGRRMPKAVRRERNRLPVTQFPHLLDTAGQRCARDRALVAVLLYTLMRDSEVTDLRVGDLDLEGGWITARIHKSGLEDRLPISAELDTELRQWLTAYTQEVGPLRPHYYLLPARRVTPVQGEGGKWTHIGESVLRPDKRMGPLWKIIGPVLEDTGFPVTDLHGGRAGEGAHTLRRSGARALFDSLQRDGYDFALRVVQSLLHHSSITVTERYVGVTADRRSRDELIRGQRMYRIEDESVLRLPTSVG